MSSSAPYRSKRLDRRTFLRGAAGAAVGLPLLECMIPYGGREALAAGEGEPGPYFITSFTGHSIGQGGSTDADQTGLFSDEVPVGDGLELTQALQPLAKTFNHPSGEMRQLKDYVSLVSNLHIGHAAENDGETPPAGIRNDPNGRAADIEPQWHGYQILPQLAAMPGENENDEEVAGRPVVTADQLVADEWGDPLSLYYRIQAGWYGGNRPSYPKSSGDSISYDGDRRIPTIDPQKAFDSMFENAPEDLGSETGEREIARRKLLAEFRKRSVVDVVHDSYKRLKSNSSLSAADRRRVEKHVQELRSLEHKIEALRERLENTQRQCTRPSRPGSLPINGSAGWSREDERGEILADLVAFAFKCGLTRVASVYILKQQSRLNLEYILGSYDNDVHGGLHSGLGGRGLDATEKIVAWDLERLGYLLARLGEIPLYPGASRSILDRTAVSLFFGGGWGLNFQGSSPRNNGHSGYNMAAFTAGGAGELVGDRHVDGQKRHPAEVAMTTMEAVGVRKQEFGELQWKTFSELRGS